LGGGQAAAGLAGASPRAGRGRVRPGAVAPRPRCPWHAASSCRPQGCVPCRQRGRGAVADECGGLKGGGGLASRPGPLRWQGSFIWQRAAPRRRGARRRGIRLGSWGGGVSTRMRNNNCGEPGGTGRCGGGRHGKNWAAGGRRRGARPFRWAQRPRARARGAPNACTAARPGEISRLARWPMPAGALSCHAAGPCAGRPGCRRRRPPREGRACCRAGGAPPRAAAAATAATTTPAAAARARAGWTAASAAA
jgi:hypothetical protein